MLTPQNLTLPHPALASLFHAAPGEDSSLFPPLASLFREARFAAPAGEDDEEVELNPEDEEGDLDDREDKEDEDDYDDEDDDEDDDRIPSPGEDEDEDDDEEEDEEEEEDDDDEEDDSSQSFILHSSRPMPRNPTIQ